jgi:ABC-type branched-subunit amino acid transport system substrate-binding protein
LLSPGYVAGSAEPAAMQFEQLFANLHGRAPTALEAYAYDAVMLIVSLADRNLSRADTATALHQVTWRGVTGTIAFGATGRRSDAAQVYSFTAANGQVSPILNLMP